MSLVFLTDGLLTTLQDTGRNGFRSLGINPNGAMDKHAVRLVNILLGNNENEGVLEIHFPAARLLFEEAAEIAFGGADFAARLNHNKVENWRIIKVQPHDVLSFAGKMHGARMYLAVRGGLAIDQWLGSLSTNLTARAGGFEGRALRKGDRLPFNFKSQISNSKSNFKISNNLIAPYSGSPTIRTTAGAEWKHLTPASQADFLTQSFTIGSESDRMGFRLRGARLNLKVEIELVSTAVNLGLVQLPPGGEPIILMADHQTTGGYPRLAHVVTPDLPILAQLGAGDRLSLAMITQKEAEDLLLNSEKKLNWLRTGCRFKNEKINN